MIVYNPIWLQLILYAAIVVFPCLSGYMFYLSYDALANSELSKFLGFTVFGMIAAYPSYIGLLLVKFVSAKIVFDEAGFVVEVKGFKRSYVWSQIASVKNYQTGQIVKLFDSTGAIICIVDHMTPGYKPFAKKVNEVVTIKNNSSKPFN